jgi:hypothetical protein
MARGWESKSIESQLEDRAAEAAAAAKEPVSPAEAARRTRRQGVSLALARARADRLTATHPSHQRMLDAAIAALSAQLDQDVS